MRREADPVASAAGLTMPVRPAGRAPNLVGILAMTGACACFVTGDTFMKLAGETLPTGQLLALRGVFATSLVLMIAFATDALAGWRVVFSPLVLVRSFLELAVSFAFITALTRLPLANISAILQAVPLLVTALAAIVLRDSVGWRRWTATSIGFLGVLLVVQPGPAGFEPASLLALGCVFGVALRDLVTRRIDPAIPTILISLSTTVLVALAGFAVAPFSSAWIAPTPLLWTYIAVASVTYSVGNLLIIMSMRIGEIPVVSPFRYTVMLFAPLLGFAVWGHVPNALACLGGGLVIASGLYTLRREAIRAREKRRGA